MAKAVIPQKALLFTGVLTASDQLVLSAIDEMSARYGKIDTISQKIPFDLSAYYNNIGENLYKVFFSFAEPIDRSMIAEIKIFTNGLENKLSSSCITRKINIDPGYLTLSNVFLASCKEYYHRMYINKGVYLENEYYFTKGKFSFFDWTYPDYKKKDYLDYFMMLRKKYRLMIS